MRGGVKRRNVIMGESAAAKSLAKSTPGGRQHVIAAAEVRARAGGACHAAEGSGMRQRDGPARGGPAAGAGGACSAAGGTGRGTRGSPRAARPRSLPFAALQERIPGHARIAAGRACGMRRPGGLPHRGRERLCGAQGCVRARNSTHAPLSRRALAPGLTWRVAHRSDGARQGRCRHRGCRRAGVSWRAVGGGAPAYRACTKQCV
jgi:hypothetical protein